MSRPAAAASLSGLEPAFRACAGELGLWSAARLFVNAAWEAGGADAVTALDEDLGGDYPVLEAVAQRALAASRPLPPPGVEALVTLCADLRRVVVVGIEADVLGPLADRLPATTDIQALVDATFPVDAVRLTASWTPRVRLTDVGAFHRAAGGRSALVTCLYGADDYTAVVAPVWLRVHSPDIRLLFRSLVGVNLAGPRMGAYPRWLGETATADFTDLVAAE